MKLYSPPAKDRKVAAQNNKAGQQVAEKLEKGAEKGRSRDQAAKEVCVSPRLVQDASSVIKNGTPELANAVRSGRLKVTRARKIAQRPKQEQEEILRAEVPQAPAPPAKTKPPCVAPEIVEEKDRYCVLFVKYSSLKSTFLTDN